MVMQGILKGLNLFLGLVVKIDRLSHREYSLYFSQYKSELTIAQVPHIAMGGGGSCPYISIFLLPKKSFKVVQCGYIDL